MLRFGIVGCGGISGTHFECLAKLEKQGLARFVAGAETNPEMRAKRETEWGIPIYGTLTEMLKRDDLDVVSVCSYSGVHGENCVEILNSGRHALCEKPMDVKLSKVDEAIAAAKKKGVTLGAIFQQRFTPGPQKVKRAIEQGYFGEIVLVHCETPWWRDQTYYDGGAWRGTWALDCGVLCNQAPHMIDRLIWLGGDVDEVISATCEPGRDRKIEAETNAVATVRLKNGALGTIIGTTLAFSGLPQRVIICGTKGSAAFSGDELVNFVTKEPFEVAPETAVDSPSGKADDASTASNPLSLWSDNHLANYVDFVQAINAGRPPSATAEDGRRVVRTLNLIYEKAGVGPFGKG